MKFGKAWKHTGMSNHNMRCFSTMMSLRMPPSSVRFRRYIKQIVKFNSNVFKINAKIILFQPHKYRGKKIENPENIAKGLQNFFPLVNSVIACGGQYFGGKFD